MEPPARPGYHGRMGRVLFGVVSDNVDPDKLGRVQVRLLEWAPEVVLPWIRVVQPFAAADLGAICLPDKGDQVVILEGPGGIPGMVVIGALYSGTRKPPKLGEAPAGDPAVRGLLTKGGSEITVDDRSGSEAITIRTKEGKVALLLDGSGKKLTVMGDTEVSIQSTSKVVVSAKEIEITGESSVKVGGSSATFALEASSVEIKGSGDVKISGASISFE
jgi:uncharacterized protein involved in type VI secretion and phage assembly